MKTLIRKQLHQELLAMETDRATMFALLEDVEDGKLRQAQKENAWSVAQVLVHLVTSEEGILSYINKKMQSESLPSANVISYLRTHALHLLINSPVRFSAPEIIASPTNDITFDELKERFNQSRTNLRQLIDDFPEKHLSKLIFRHPISGRISLLHCYKFIRLHNKRHYRQIDRILKSIN